MTEADAWDSIRPLFGQLGLDPIRVENVLHPGHPDVDYTHGNIELKALDAFPARGPTKVRIPTLTGQQVGWLTRRWEKGGNCWLLVRVGREWFLFCGKDARTIWKGRNQTDWRIWATFVFTTGDPPHRIETLRRILTGTLGR